MGQIEVYEWLKTQRLAGDNRFFCIREIEKGMRACGLYHDFNGKIWGAVVMLEAYGYLDVRKEGQFREFRRVVRLKNKYVRCVHG